MTSSTPTTVTLLFQALEACAADRSLQRRIGDGKLHEDMVFSGLGGIAKEVGLEVQLIELAVSNYPLEMRDQATKPADYKFRVKRFLEVEGGLLRLDHRNSGWAGLYPLNFDSRDEALANLPQKGIPLVGGYHEWSLDTEDQLGDQVGLRSIEACNDLDALRLSLLAAHAEKLAAHLDQNTPAAPGTSRGLRL